MRSLHRNTITLVRLLELQGVYPSILLPDAGANTGESAVTLVVTAPTSAGWRWSAFKPGIPA